MANFIGWLLDLCPIVGGIKMTIEGLRGKTFLSKQNLQGFGRLLHLAVGITSIIADFISVGVGGIIERGVGKILTRSAVRGLEKEAVKVEEKVAEKQLGKVGGATSPKTQGPNENPQNLKQQAVGGEKNKGLVEDAKNGERNAKLKENAFKYAKKYRGSYDKEKEREKGITGYGKEFMENYNKSITKENPEEEEDKEENIEKPEIGGKYKDEGIGRY